MPDISNVYQFLMDKLQQELEQVSESGNWFDPLISKIKTEIDGSTLGSEYKEAAQSAVGILEQNKTSILELGAYGLTLFLFQIGLGKSDAAIETYIQALNDPDDLIALVNSGTYGVVQAKQKLDQMQSAAISLMKTIGIDAAKALIPLLLSLV